MWNNTVTAAHLATTDVDKAEVLSAFFNKKFLRMSVVRNRVQRGKNDRWQTKTESEITAQNLTKPVASKGSGQCQ